MVSAPGQGAKIWFTCIVIVPSLSHVRLFATQTAACQAALSITISQSLLKLISVESVMPSNHLILCYLLLLLSSIFPGFRVFPNESTLRMRWPKYWSFSFSIIPSKEIPGLISFRMDWLDPAVTRAPPPAFPRNPRGRLGFPGPTQGDGGEGVCVCVCFFFNE